MATWAQKVGYPTNKPVRIPHKKIAAAIDALEQEVVDRAERTGAPFGGIPNAFLSGQYKAATRTVAAYMRDRRYQEAAARIVEDLQRPLTRPSWYVTPSFQEFPALWYTFQRGERSMLRRVLLVLIQAIPSLCIPECLFDKCLTPERTQPHDMLEYAQAKRIGRKLAARSGKKRYIFNTPYGYQVSSKPPTEHNGYVIAKPNGDFVFIRPDWQYPNDKNRVERVEHPRYTKFGW